MLTTFEGDAQIQRAFKAGVRAYLLKSIPTAEMITVIRQVHQGSKHVPAAIASKLAEHFGDDSLTQREVEVLAQIAAGNRNRDIGVRLFVCEETVKTHVKNIIAKLHANDRTQAVMIGLKRGFIQV